MAKRTTSVVSAATLDRGYVKLPVLILSREEFDAKMAQVKKKSGKSLDLGEVRDPTAPATRQLAVAKTIGKGGGVASPKRRHAHCHVVDADTLGLVFGIISEYGGIVCFR